MIRKLCTTMLLGLVLSLGTAYAQTESPEAAAKAKVSAIHDEVQLTGDQQYALYTAYVEYEINLRTYILDKDQTNPAVIQEKKSYDKALETAVRNNLNEEQFAAWKDISL